MNDATWLPNLVGGTSIWKLAVDLNEEKFFGGRLLVPETEGSESLPVTVRWDLTGLVPLKEAREKHPDDAAAAVRDFQSALERVAKVFATPNSGFDKYKDAFTVPSLDADDGANYFYSPTTKKLFVVNWGASPRSMGGKAEYVFGYEDWGRHWGAPAAAGAIAAAAGGAAVATPAVATPAGEATGAGEPEKRDERKQHDRARPWWMWPLFGLIAIVLVLLALFLLKACEEHKIASGADASDAPAEGAAGDDDASAAAGDGGGDDDGADGAAHAGDDAGGEAGADGHDGGTDHADAASADAAVDGGLASDDDDDDDDFPTAPGGGGAGGGGAGGGGAGGGGGGPVVKIGPGGGDKTSVHRKHYSDDAQAWRIAAGAHKVSRTEQAGRRFDVWLSPGQSFEGVRVEWQDKAGTWHVH
ncbi:MAG: hypothetical protein KF850_34535 [Labilithrix sp.]|nr:hypothetical protein [Labilithrix sp.]